MLQCSKALWREDLFIDQDIYWNANSLFSVIFGKDLKPLTASEDTNRPFYSFHRHAAAISVRELTYSSDSKEAFAAISQFLEKYLQTPMFYDCPVEYFHWSLLGPCGYLQRVPR
jgi:hypothetical protein